ncbi:MAG TPA: hypothetical protein VGR91_10915 [Stellaceae bacterium]|nr:hypothetical protein [Stellaceae bacterium]
MRKTAAALAALGLLSAITATLPATAEARDWHRGWRGEEWSEHHDHDHDRGPAIALGIIGGILAGAAVASSHPYAPPAYYYGAPYAGYGYYQ